MKKFSVVWLGMVLVFCLGYVPSASAAIIAPGGVWSSLIPSEIDNDGNPYWDGESYDGAECGIGWLLTSGSCSHAPSAGLTDLEYLHNGAGDPVSFTFSGPVLAGFSFFGEITAWEADGTLEWYDVSNPASTGLIFSGSDAPGAAANPMLPAVYGFKFTSRDGSYLSGDNSAGQFALFRQMVDDEVRYVLGIEDIKNFHGPYVSDRDNNDMVVGFAQSNPNSVPEPASLTLLTLGVLLGANRLRQRRDRVSAR